MSVRLTYRKKDRQEMEKKKQRETKQGKNVEKEKL